MSPCLFCTVYVPFLGPCFLHTPRVVASDRTNVSPPGKSIGLNLCDPRQILSPQQQEELDRDLAEMARVRRVAWAKSQHLVVG